MYGNFLEDVMFEIQRNWKRRVFIPLGIVIAFAVIAAIVAGGIYIAAERARPSAANSEDIPLGSYAASNIQVLDCIYRGPKECTEYEKSKEWMSGATTGSITYTPIKGDKSAPGEKIGNDAREVTAFQSLSDKEWHSLAAGLTLEGEANPGTVTENSVKTTGFELEAASATATFPLTGGKSTTGTMTFTLKDSGVALTGISYGDSQ